MKEACNSKEDELSSLSFCPRAIQKRFSAILDYFCHPCLQNLLCNLLTREDFFPSAAFVKKGKNASSNHHFRSEIVLKLTHCLSLKRFFARLFPPSTIYHLWGPIIFSQQHPFFIWRFCSRMVHLQLREVQDDNARSLIADVVEVQWWVQ